MADPLALRASGALEALSHGPGVWGGGGDGTGSGGSNLGNGSGHGDGGWSGVGAGPTSHPRSGAGVGRGPASTDGAGSGDSGEEHGSGDGFDDPYVDPWGTAHTLALQEDLRRLPGGLADALPRDPQARSVALDLAREQGLRTLLEALRR